MKMLSPCYGKPKASAEQEQDWLAALLQPGDTKKPVDDIIQIFENLCLNNNLPFVAPFDVLSFVDRNRQSLKWSEKNKTVCIDQSAMAETIHVLIDSYSTKP